MKFTLNKAAKVSGRAKSTLLKAINSNKMSAPKGDNGHYEIDASELNRVFPYTVSDHAENRYVKPIQTTTENRLETSALEVEVKLLREQLDDRDKTVSDLRDRLDRSENQRAAITERLLPAPENPTRPHKGLWDRLTRR